jgi:DNA-binding response OmpR family regulator
MSRADAPRGGRTILVVDDDQALRDLFTALLTRNGFQVDVAPDGRAARDKLESHDYRCILLDLMMPDVNGFELLDSLQRESPALMPRVIVMTGASRRVIESLDVREIWGLIRKPFDIHQLLDSATACCDGRRGRKSLEQ